MIRVNPERCTGCGACVEVCPAGAIHIAGGHAVVDEVLCRLCETCISACPEMALSSVPVVVVPTSRTQYLPQAPSSIATQVTPASRAVASWRERILPALGALVGVATRYVIPRLVETLLSTKTQGPSVGGGQGGTGLRWQHRHRRGG